MLIKTICWVDIILYIRLFGLRRVKFRLVRVGVGWVAGLNENITNSAKLGLTRAEFGNEEIERLQS